MDNEFKTVESKASRKRKARLMEVEPVVEEEVEMKDTSNVKPAVPKFDAVKPNAQSQVSGDILELTIN